MKSKAIYTFLILLLLSLATENTAYAQFWNKKKDTKQENEKSSLKTDLEVSGIFIDALNAIDKGEYENAIGMLNQCISKRQNHAASYYELAKIYFEKQDFMSSKENALKAIKYQPDNLWYLFALMNINKALGEQKEYLETIQKLIKLDPENLDFKFELAVAYLTNGKGQKAIDTYNEIEKIMGISEEISLQKQRLYAIQNKFNEATNEIEKLAETFPEEKSRYYGIIAEMYNKVDKKDLAAKYYQKIASNDPDDPYVHISLSDFYKNEGKMDKAFEEMKKGFANPKLDIDTKIRVLMTFFSLDEAIDKYKNELLELTKQLAETHPTEAKAHAIYGDFLFDDKQIEKARDSYRKVLSLDSSRYAVWENLLNIETQLNDIQAMKSESARAIELFPMQTIPYYINGIANFQSNDYQNAIESFERGRKLVVANNQLLMQYYVLLGDAYNKQKDYEKSDEYYEKSLQIEPNNALVMNNYAYNLAVRGENLKKALEMSEKSVALDPENSANMDTHGWVFYKMGNYPEALKWILKSIEKRNDDPVLLEHLGDVYFKLNKIDDAMKYWQKAYSASPTSQGLKYRIEEKKIPENEK